MKTSVLRIRDPVPFSIPGSGMGEKSGSGIFLVKKLKFFDADPGSVME
jgi:hypothetical protein